MILVDSATGSCELLPLIQRIGEAGILSNLPYGDFAFEGNGPQGTVTIGIERKALHDMLHCIDDARFGGFQAGGMRDLYPLRFLIVEGLWKPHDNEGYLMEGFKGGAAWGVCRYRSRVNPYSKLFNFLISAAMGGFIVVQTRDPYHTAYNVCEIYRYFQKPWNSHTSMFEVQSFPIDEVGGRASLCRRWAIQIDGIGVKLSSDIEQMFKTPIALAKGDETMWARLRGVSVQSARRIVREIWGTK